MSIAAHGDRTQLVAVKTPHVTVSCLAKPGRVFEHRVEYRSEIAGRGVDDAKHLAGRGFSSQRLIALGLVSITFGCARRKLGRALLQLAWRSAII